MSKELQGDSLILDETTLPASGNDGEVRYDTATKSYVQWSDTLTAWVAFGASTIGQTTTDLQDVDRTIAVGSTYHHPNLIIATTRTWTVNGSLAYHCSLTLNGTAVLSVPSGGLVCP